MSRRTDAPPPTADRELDRIVANLRARFDGEVASASRPEPAPKLSLSDGSSPEGAPPSLPPVAAREVPLIRPGLAASARADPLAARALGADVAAVSRYAREEAARLAAFARKLELGVRNAETSTAPGTLDAWRAAADACARRATLAGDVLEHAIEVVDACGSPPFATFEAVKSDDAKNAKSASVEGPHPADVRGVSFSRALRNVRAAFEPVVLAASAAYAETRARRDPAAGETPGGTWRPPDAFERKTAKYWVEPKHALALKLELAKHLPVLVFPAEEKNDEKGSKEKQAAARDGGAVTSVYLDSADAAVYDSRLTREQGATLVRARWYGDRDARTSEEERSAVSAGSSPVFVERKTHHESWSRDGSTKERFALRRRDARAYLNGTLSNVEGALLFDKGGEAARAARRRLAEEIARFELGERRVAPSVRTEYRRVAFQRSDDNAVRVSLDVDLAFADARSTLRESLFSAPGSAETVAFPFAVLEIKTRDETPPEWVEHVLGSVPCVEVRKFSKFLHATMLTRRRESRESNAKKTLRAPHWWSDDGDAGVDRLAVCARRVATYGDARFDAPEREEEVFVPVTPTPGPGSSVVGRERDLESGLLDQPLRDDASDGGSGGSSSGVSRGAPERAEAQFLLGGGGGARAAAAARAPTSRCAPFALLAPRGNDAGVNGARLGAKPFFAAEGRFSRKASTRVSYVPTKVEPKTFFANERTLLQWLSMSVLLLFAALALLGGATATATAATSTAPTTTTSETTFTRDADGVASPAPNARNASMSGPSRAPRASSLTRASFLGGAALAAVSVAFMAYALWTYLWRARRIARREPSARYDDVAGPTALVVVLVVVSSVAAVAAVADAARARRRL